MHRFVGGLSLLAALAVAVTLIVLNEEPEAREQPEGPLTVAVETLRPIRVTDRIVGYGEARPRWQTQLASEVTGRVRLISPDFLAGARFRAGDVLVTLDPTGYETAVAQAASALAAARRVLKEEQHRAKVAAETWEASGLKGKPTALALRKPQLAEARAAVTAARAGLKQAQHDLAQTTITAPYDGVVLERSINPGDFLQPGDPIGRIFDRRVFEIPVPLGPDEIARLPVPARDAAVRLEDRVTGRHWVGRVARIAQALDARNRWREVIVEVTEADGLLPGQFLKASFAGRPHGGVLKVAERQLGRGGRLWYVDAQNRLQSVTPEIVFARQGHVFIRSPLDGGGPLRITRYRSGLLDGMRVQAVPEASGPSPASDDRAETRS